MAGDFIRYTINCHGMTNCTTGGSGGVDGTYHEVSATIEDYRSTSRTKTQYMVGGGLQYKRNMAGSAGRLLYSGQRNEYSAALLEQAKNPGK